MRVLSIDGGGYLGLATAAFIAGVESHAQTRLHEHFDLFCGTSTGALIALGLAKGMSGTEIADMYRSLGKTVFEQRRDVPFLARRCPGALRAKYALGPLAEALSAVFGDLTLADLFRDGKNVLITSYSVTAGAPRIFKTDHSSQLSLHNRYRVADVALASAAAPTYFPLVSLAHPATGVAEQFCDGGVVANHPALLGLAEALFEFRASACDVRLLSLSTPRRALAEPLEQSTDRGIYQWKDTLPAVMIDSPSTISHELLRRLVASYPAPRPLYERVELKNPSGFSFDEVSERSTQELVRIGTQDASSGAMRERLRPFLEPNAIRPE